MSALRVSGPARLAGAPVTIVPTMSTPRAPRQLHPVYVVLLDDRVWNEPARDMEVELAIGLRESGYGVWQA